MASKKTVSRKLFNLKPPVPSPIPPFQVKNQPAILQRYFNVFFLLLEFINSFLCTRLIGLYSHSSCEVVSMMVIKLKLFLLTNYL